MNDELSRKCVADLVDDAPERVLPAGRLDKDSEGLLLFSNDGEFINLMTHPSGHVPKIYRVTVRPPVSDEQLLEMSNGIVIDGKKTARCSIVPLVDDEKRVVLEFELNEGRNRQIRKMCESVGLEVARLKRVAVGNLRLGRLPVGKWRLLEKQEIRDLITLSKAKSGGAKT